MAKEYDKHDNNNVLMMRDRYDNTKNMTKCDDDDDDRCENDNSVEREVESVKSPQELHNGRLMLAKSG